VTQTRDLKVDDRPERRIRKPVDALRCFVSCGWIIVLVFAAVEASAATAGAETDIVGASKRLPQALLVVVPPISLFALFALPVALAVATLVRRQVRRLVEAAATGLLAGIVADIANIVLRHQAFSRLYYAVIMALPGTSHVNALDPYLAGLVAYVTMIGLAGRAAWRNASLLTIGVYAVVQLATSRTTAVSLLLTLLTGRAIGFAIRWGAGSASQRPSAQDIAAALAAGTTAVVTAITRRPQPRESAPGAAGSRLYEVTTQGNGQLDVVVFDRDQQAAGAFYRLYRWVRVRGQVARTAPLSFDRTVERRALLSYAAQDAAVATPQLRNVARVGPEAALLAYDHCDGVTLAQRHPGCTEAELGRIWDAVTRMHAHHVTHRGLTADRILFSPSGQVVLLDPGDGDVAATDLQIRLDLAQLIVELALYAGPEESARLATERLHGGDLAAVVPLLQPVVLVRSTRHAVRRRRDVLPAIRKALLAAEPAAEVAPVRLERIPPRTLVTLIASVAAIYLLAGELAQASLGSILRSADWRWGLVALGLSATTYVGAALSVSGWVSERLNFVRTLLVQLASSFVTLVTPAAVGGVALNIRYLQRKKIPAPVAVASIGVSQVVAFVLHILMLITFAAIAGTGTGNPIRPPAWAYFVVLGLVVAAGVVLAFPAGRRTVRARLSPTFGQVLPRLVDIAQQPRKLAEGLGGALLLSATYILCLSACVAAFGRDVPFAKIGVVYLTGSAIGSIIPTPGGLGAVEAALTAGLTAAGVPGGVAVSSVLLFRLLTFWLPVPVGWAAFNYLERHNDLLPEPPPIRLVCANGVDRGWRLRKRAHPHRRRLRKRPRHGRGSGGLAGQLEGETHGLREGSPVGERAVGERAEGGREVGVERRAPLAEHRVGEGGRRPHVPGELRQAPAVLDGELGAAGRLEPGVRQHLTIGPAPQRQLPVRGHPVFDVQRRSPPVHRGGHRPLPVLVARPRPGRPAQREAAARPQPAEDPAGDYVAVQPVERVADHRELEVPGLRVEGFRARQHRPHFRRRGTRSTGLDPDRRDHVRFGVHGPYLAEPRAQREGELPGPAGQVEQSPLPGDHSPRHQVRDHRLGVRQPVPVVVPGGAAEQVRREPWLFVHHTYLFTAYHGGRGGI